MTKISKFQILNYLSEVENDSDCGKRKVGAILLNSKLQPVASGANRIPVLHNISECEACANGKSPLLCPALHAEIKAFSKLSMGCIIASGIRIMAISYSPCPDCCKAIMDAGIKTVLIKEPRTRLVSPEITAQYEVLDYDKLSQKLLPGVQYIRLWKFTDDTEWETGATYLTQLGGQHEGNIC